MKKIGTYRLGRSGWVCNICGKIWFSRRLPKSHKPCGTRGTKFFGSEDDDLSESEAKVVLALLAGLRARKK